MCCYSHPKISFFWRWNTCANLPAEHFCQTSYNRRIPSPTLKFEACKEIRVQEDVQERADLPVCRIRRTHGSSWAVNVQSCYVSPWNLATGDWAKPNYWQLSNNSLAKTAFLKIKLCASINFSSLYPITNCMYARLDTRHHHSLLLFYTEGCQLVKVTKKPLQQSNIVMESLSDDLGIWSFKKTVVEVESKHK